MKNDGSKETAALAERVASLVGHKPKPPTITNAQARSRVASQLARGLAKAINGSAEFLQGNTPEEHEALNLAARQTLLELRKRAIAWDRMRAKGAN